MDRLKDRPVKRNCGCALSMKSTLDFLEIVVGLFFFHMHIALDSSHFKEERPLFRLIGFFFWLSRRILSLQHCLSVCLSECVSIPSLTLLISTTYEISSIAQEGAQTAPL